ncbi:hypothetical protein B0H14DRAFT_2572073 [Mycena olivaceomarginata]|nr:hypothetical protein B0H14DRAFT_2572073 [Mycena olivaceomarginata]
MSPVRRTALLLPAAHEGFAIMVTLPEKSDARVHTTCADFAYLPWLTGVSPEAPLKHFCIELTAGAPNAPDADAAAQPVNTQVTAMREPGAASWKGNVLIFRRDRGLLVDFAEDDVCPGQRMCKRDCPTQPLSYRRVLERATHQQNAQFKTVGGLEKTKHVCARSLADVETHEVGSIGPPLPFGGKILGPEKKPMHGKTSKKLRDTGGQWCSGGDCIAVAKDKP